VVRTRTRLGTHSEGQFPAGCDAVRCGGSIQDATGASEWSPTLPNSHGCQNVSHENGKALVRLPSQGSDRKTVGSSSHRVWFFRKSIFKNTDKSMSTNALFTCVIHAGVGYEDLSSRRRGRFPWHTLGIRKRQVAHRRRFPGLPDPGRRPSRRLKLAQDIRADRRRRWRSARASLSGASPTADRGAGWHHLATFRRVFITDLHGQNRFRTLVRNGSVHSPVARTTGSRSGAWDDPSGQGDASPVSGVGTRVAGPADHRPACWFQDLGAHRFRSSEMVAAIGRSVKNPQRAVGLFSLQDSAFCRFH
jgi:hypothetical protein